MGGNIFQDWKESAYIVMKICFVLADYNRYRQALLDQGIVFLL